METQETGYHLTGEEGDPRSGAPPNFAQDEYRPRILEHRVVRFSCRPFTHRSEATVFSWAASLFRAMLTRVYSPRHYWDADCLLDRKQEPETAAARFRLRLQDCAAFTCSSRLVSECP